MNQFAGKQLASVKDTLQNLGLAKLAGLGAAAVLVLGLISWIATHSAEPMGLLYAGLDPAEAGRITQRLEELKVPFEARGDGSTVLVPASQVGRMRMALAASGLPRQGGAGYELLDSQSPMNMTSFMQRIQRLRALEGELARTIVTLDGVRTARVHIVLPERESFSRDAPKPTASVAVVMNGPMRINPRQAEAIRLLVAGAVPQLQQEDVSVLDPSGVVLAASGQDALAADRLEEMKSLRERALQGAALSLLEPLIGRGKVKVAVSADIDSTREISREEKFDPLSQVERSKQTQVDEETSNETKQSQSVSVGQNLPNPNNQQQDPNQGQGQSVPGRSASTAKRDGQTVNYEISNTRSERVREPGALRRLTVAVVVDGVPDDKGAFQPRPKEELERIADLVKSAVGFDAKRGDTVTVDTMKFLAADGTGADIGGADSAAAGQPYWMWPVVAVVALVLVCLLLLVFGRRLLLTPAGRRQDALASPGVSTLLQGPVAAADAAAAVSSDERVLLANMPEPIQATAVTALHELVDSRPDESMAVIRAWLTQATTKTPAAAQAQAS